LGGILEYLPLIFLLGIITAIWAVLYLYRKYHRIQKDPLFFTENFLYSPGESLFKQIDTVNEEIMLLLVSICILPLAAYSALISPGYFGGARLNSGSALISLLISLIFAAYIIVKWVNLRSRHRILRLGYEGKVAVGQELNRLMLEGYHVYHDFPAEEFSIDHIVVGPKGVFAVETETRAERTARNRIEDATVTYDGRALFFPKATDVETVAQAERQTSWLSTWLTQVLGEPVAARAIVALPGWFVRRTSPDGISVINPKQFASLFEHIQPRALTPIMITRIAEQLEQKCRKA
jgi:hypothetical protein